MTNFELVITKVIAVGLINQLLVDQSVYLSLFRFGPHILLLNQNL